jgi:hypothetical protein
MRSLSNIIIIITVVISNIAAADYRASVLSSRPRLICAAEYNQERRVCVCVFFSVPSRPNNKGSPLGCWPAEMAETDRFSEGVCGRRNRIMQLDSIAGNPGQLGIIIIQTKSFLVVDVIIGGKRCDVDAYHTVCKRGRTLYRRRALPRPRGQLCAFSKRG